MGIMIWFGYFIGGFFLFLLLRYLKRKYIITMPYHIVFSMIYLLVVAGVCSFWSWKEFNENIFLILIFEFVIRLLYTTYFLGQDFFEEEGKNFGSFIVSVIMGYILNQSVINQVSQVFLTAEEWKSMLWLLTVSFLLFFFKDHREFSVSPNREESQLPSKKRIVLDYAKLKCIYDEEISFPNLDLELLCYSIMIFENRRRPVFWRKLDNFLFRIDGKSRNLGIMQIKSKKFISDIESIEIALKKLAKLYEKKKEEKSCIQEVIFAYQKEQDDTIFYIYQQLKKFY